MSAFPNNLVKPIYRSPFKTPLSFDWTETVADELMNHFLIDWHLLLSDVCVFLEGSLAELDTHNFGKTNNCKTGNSLSKLKYYYFILSICYYLFIYLIKFYGEFKASLQIIKLWNLRKNFYWIEQYQMYEMSATFL